MSKSRHSRGRNHLVAKGAQKTVDGLFLQQSEEDLEFEVMDRVYAFSVDVLETDTTDPTGFRYQQKVFKTGDDVILNSNFDNTDDIWLGQISQIRTTKDKVKTLAKVRWYWSRNDVAKLIKSFDIRKCSPYERILSDDYDYVSPHAFQAPTHVYEYHEDDLNPPPIEPTTFFLRTTLLHRKKHIKPPLGQNTCMCHEAYNPYPSFVSTDDMTISANEPSDTMHFCPSLNCRKWYHSKCLALMQNVDTTSHPSTRSIRLLANDPDSEAPFVMFSHFSEPESREIVPDSTEQMTIYDALALWTRPRTILEHLPPALLAIAQCPIVRTPGAPHGWAIGNVADVVLARRFVYTAVEHGGPPERSAKFLELLRRERARMEDLFWLERRRQTRGDMVDVDVDVDSTRRDHERESIWGGLWDGIKDAGDSDCEDVDMDREGTVSTLKSSEDSLGKGVRREPDEVSALEALCEDLGQFELLASPYAPYWERRGREFEAAASLMVSPDFVCPQCRSAI